MMVMVMVLVMVMMVVIRQQGCGYRKRSIFNPEKCVILHFKSN